MAQYPLGSVDTYHWYLPLILKWSDSYKAKLVKWPYLKNTRIYYFLKQEVSLLQCIYWDISVACRWSDLGLFSLFVARCNGCGAIIVFFCRYHDIKGPWTCMRAQGDQARVEGGEGYSTDVRPTLWWNRDPTAQRDNLPKSQKCTIYGCVWLRLCVIIMLAPICTLSSLNPRLNPTPEFISQPWWPSWWTCWWTSWWTSSWTCWWPSWWTCWWTSWWTCWWTSWWTTPVWIDPFQSLYGIVPLACVLQINSHKSNSKYMYTREGGGWYK